jgi:RHS repeat-associated protein
MAVTNYHTVNSRILGETTGGVRTDYLTDALGSVTATVNPSAQVINRYTYKPYGGLLAKTGVGADPVNQWVGSLGYRQTGKKYSDVYVRARHYDTLNGRWTSKDPIGFGGGDWNLFRYVRNSILDATDPSGKLHLGKSCIDPVPGVDCACTALRYPIVQKAVDGVCPKILSLNEQQWQNIAVCATNGLTDNHRGQCDTYLRPGWDKIMSKFRGYCSQKPDLEIRCVKDCPSDDKDPTCAEAFDDNSLDPHIDFCLDVLIPCTGKSQEVKWNTGCKAGNWDKTFCPKNNIAIAGNEPLSVLLHEMTHMFTAYSITGSNKNCKEWYADILTCCIMKELGIVNRR